MSDEEDHTAKQEQLERRRLSRLIEALPAFSGFTTPDGHLLQSRPPTDESFLWTLPFFTDTHDSVTQIVDLCERASKGERIQIERPYVKSEKEETNIYGRGLLTLSPIFDDKGHVDELAVTLLDCDETGLAPRDEFAKSRLAEANSRIESMLSLAQIVIEASRSKQGAQERDQLSDRLNALASVIDIICDPAVSGMQIDPLIFEALDAIPSRLKNDRLQLMTNGGEVPISAIPIMMLLFTELVANARQHGAWRDTDRDKGTVSIQSEILDSVQGRVLRLHWIEDGGPRVSAVLGRGFGLTLGERLFPQITGGASELVNSEEGLSWRFELPIEETDAGFLGGETGDE